MSTCCPYAASYLLYSMCRLSAEGRVQTSMLILRRHTAHMLLATAQTARLQESSVRREMEQEFV